jgi:23S rRNA (cytosine1962-C5)-methyltransferase
MSVRAAGYQLIDAGDGRRLERFGDRVVDRPAPGATDAPRNPSAWDAADLRFDPGTGWTGRVEPWTMTQDGLTFELRPTDAGQVGVFPEQMPNWQWLREHVEPGMKVLNLFAYTGGSTLASAASGARVVHVDAARPSVTWARRNAELSGLTDRPIRWLVDDAGAFVRREARRGRRYDGIVLDPPSYGHGGSTATWRLETGLPELLVSCRAITNPGAFLVLTAHSEGMDASWLGERFSDAFDQTESIETLELELTATGGARLWLGSCARMISGG